MTRNPLIRELAAVLAIKLLILSLLWFVFFRPTGGHEKPAAVEVAHALLSTGAMADRGER